MLSSVALCANLGGEPAFDLAMYFYALQTKATHVVGSVTENPSGIYTMHVVEGTAAQFFSGTLNPTYTCTLANTTLNPKGPGNTVQVGCMFIGLCGGVRHGYGYWRGGEHHRSSMK